MERIPEIRRDLVADLDAFMEERLRKPSPDAGVGTKEWALAGFLKRNENEDDVRAVLEKHGFSAVPAPVESVLSGERFIVANPDWEFFPTLNDWTDRVRAAGGKVVPGGVRPQVIGQSYYSELFKLNSTSFSGVRHAFRGHPTVPVFSMQVVAKCRDGFVADIVDPMGILDNIRKVSKAHVEMEPANRDPEGSRLAGPYPVIDGAVLFEAIEARVCCKANLDLIGALEEHTYKDGTEKPVLACPYEETGVEISPDFSFTMKEIEEEFSARNSCALGNYSYDDLAIAANGLYMDLDPLAEYSHSELLSRLCDRVEGIVDGREVALKERCDNEGFMDDIFKGVVCKEEHVVDIAEDMKGLKRSKDRGALLGSADGYDVVIRPQSSARFSDGKKHVVFIGKHGGRAEGYQNAVRRDPEMNGILNKVLEQAQRRDRNIRRMEKFNLSEIFSRNYSKPRKIR